MVEKETWEEPMSLCVKKGKRPEVGEPIVEVQKVKKDFVLKKTIFSSRAYFDKIFRPILGKRQKRAATEVYFYQRRLVERQGMFFMDVVT